MGEEEVGRSRIALHGRGTGRLCMGAGLSTVVVLRRRGRKEYRCSHGRARSSRMGEEEIGRSVSHGRSSPNLRLHMTRLSCAVVESAGPATKASRGGPSPEPPRR